MRISDWSSDVCSSDLQGAVVILWRASVRLVQTRWTRIPRTGSKATKQSSPCFDGRKTLRDDFLKGLTGVGHRVRRSNMDSTRSEKHRSDLQSLMRTSNASSCLKKKNTKTNIQYNDTYTK